MLERLAIAIELFHPSLQPEVGHRSENPVRAHSSRAWVRRQQWPDAPSLGALARLSH
jgi:hypothetical protein